MYNQSSFQINRPSPLVDKHLSELTKDIMAGAFDTTYTSDFYNEFRTMCSNWILSSKLNVIKNIDTLPNVDLMHGCTHFIDSLYMQGKIQVLKNDYRYHERLGTAIIADNINDLIPTIPLIISNPFPSTGTCREDFTQILEYCNTNNIAVHIDAAWYTTAKNVCIDASHPAIKSIGISLSKGLGLGWNRIGIRWARHRTSDAIDIANNFNMINRAPCLIARHFIKNTNPDHLWNTHKSRYRQICKDFSLTPTDTIYLAMSENGPVGVSPLIQYLENSLRN